MRTRALGSPKEATGALCHVGSRVRASARNAANRGQSGQFWSGSAGEGSRLFVEIVVTGSTRRHGGGALQELRRVVARLAMTFAAALTALARGRALGRIAAELGLQF